MLCLRASPPQSLAPHSQVQTGKRQWYDGPGKCISVVLLERGGCYIYTCSRSERYCIDVRVVKFELSSWKETVRIESKETSDVTRSLSQTALQDCDGGKLA